MGGVVDGGGRAWEDVVVGSRGVVAARRCGGSGEKEGRGGEGGQHQGDEAAGRHGGLAATRAAGRGGGGALDVEDAGCFTAGALDRSRELKVAAAAAAVLHAERGTCRLLEACVPRTFGKGKCVDQGDARGKS